jgi:hypothetical protein
MTQVWPVALLVESDLGFLSEAEQVLRSGRYQTIARLSPEGLSELAGALHPELILVGVDFWRRGWGTLFRVFSPDSLVFPIGVPDVTNGVLSLQRLSSLVTRESTEESHAA